MPDDLRSDHLDGDDDLQQLRTLVGRIGAPDHDRDQPPADLWDRIAAEAGVPTGSPTGPTEPPAVTLDDRRRQRGRPGAWLLAAAAAVLVAVAIGVLVRPSGDDGTVVASTELDRLAGAGSGRAELVERDGSLQLRLDTSGLDAGDGFLEVWVIDPEVTKLVSLGPLRADGVHELPPGIDPAEFPIVDVSVEPVDGDPTHSGASLLRGELTS